MISEEVIVTGSRIRRVDAETASPVVVINSDAIQASGATTIGRARAQAADDLRRPERLRTPL